MSSSLIKMTPSLKTHPKINQLAALLENPTDGSAGLAVAIGSQQSAMLTRNISRSVAITSLIIIWNAAREHAQEGVFHNVDLSYLDSLADYPGFGEAMIASGWAAYDKKKKCITLAIVSEDQKVAVKKSPGAMRQKEYRERLKMKNCLTKDITGGCRAPCNNIVQRCERVEVIPRLVHEDNGVTRFGSIVIEGVAYEVTSSPKSSRSSVTQGITGNVTAGGLSVTRGITDSVTAGDLSVTPDITDSVTAGDLSVTQGITDSVTADDFSVTPDITVDDFDVTRSDPAVTCSKNPSRVIPSRAHTRFSFLRSKTLRSKHKTTHTAREDNFQPVDNFQPETTRGQSRRSLHQGMTKGSHRHRAGYVNNRLCEQRVSAMLNVTHSLTLLRRGNESVCLTRKQANRDKPQQPIRSRTVLDIFPMYHTWKPSADFLEMAGRLGIELHADPDYAELTEFTSYWAAGQAEHTQQQWELKLGRCLAKGRRRGRKNYPAKRDITIMPSADYAIPEGFRGG